MTIQKDAIIHYLRALRHKIIRRFESYEPQAKFEKTAWQHHSGGGGEIALLKGDVFEKAAVNFSAVSGEQFPMGDASGPFFATGVSLITHMKNPKAPTVHMNLRYIETPDKFWWGGGYDLTPMGFPYPEDTDHFHKVAKDSLAPYGETLYQEFAESAKTYFFIPHRQKERGVGGLFFDHFNTGRFSRDFSMWQAIGDNFLEAICPILDRRVHAPYTPQEKELQCKMRGHYVEFNLIYDRGTKFGFSSKGNPEAILCSMPPTATW